MSVTRGGERRRAVAWGWVGLWLVFVAYAVAFAPPDDPALVRSLVIGMLTGRFGDVDPAIAAVFMMLGVVPVLASAFVLRDGATRRLPAWPFALAMFVVGAMALLPWLALRGVLGPRTSPRPAGSVRRLLSRRSFSWGIVVGLVGLAAWGAIAGSARAYAHAFRTTSLVNVMTLDLALCSVLLLVQVEEARRTARHDEPKLARAARVVPLLGAALWNALVVRPA